MWILSLPLHCDSTSWFQFNLIVRKVVFTQEERSAHCSTPNAHLLLKTSPRLAGYSAMQHGNLVLGTWSWSAGVFSTVLSLAF